MKYLIFLIMLTSPAFAGTAFLKSEYITGTTKQCVYDYLGNTYVVTIPNTKICQLTIEVVNGTPKVKL